MKVLTGRILGYVVAGAIAAGLLFWVFGKLDSYFASQDRAITEASRAQLALHPAMARMRAKMRALEQRALQAEVRASSWATTARLAQAQRDAADSAARVAAGQPVLPPSPWRAIADSEHAAHASCSLAYLSCSHRAESAEAEVDSLSRRLAAQITVRNHPCGITAGLGVAAGARAAWGASILVGCQLLRSPWP